MFNFPRHNMLRKVQQVTADNINTKRSRGDKADFYKKFSLSKLQQMVKFVKSYQVENFTIYAIFCHCIVVTEILYITYSTIQKASSTYIHRKVVKQKHMYRNFLTVIPIFLASVESVILANGLSAPQHSTYLVILLEGRDRLGRPPGVAKINNKKHIKFVAQLLTI